ncbi:hypothetical protein PtrSN002B_010318, partial [Pyrenophora tritici-repentis]
MSDTICVGWEMLLSLELPGGVGYDASITITTNSGSSDQLLGCTFVQTLPP